MQCSVYSGVLYMYDSGGIDEMAECNGPRVTDEADKGHVGLVVHAAARVVSKLRGLPRRLHAVGQVPCAGCRACPQNSSGRGSYFVDRRHGHFVGW